MNHYVIAYTARRVDVSIILVSGKIMAKSGKKWQKVGVKVSLLQGRESDIFREEKIRKKRNLSRSPMTKGHGEVISRILFKCEKLGLKNLFSEKSPLKSEMLTFFRASLVFQCSWKREV